MLEMLMHFPELPHYLKVKRIVDGDTVSVAIESNIHAEKVVKMPTSFSIGFIDLYPGRFRDDVLAFVVKRYGLKQEPVRYS